MTTNGNDTILTVVDRFSKEAHFIPCDSTLTAENLASLFLKEIYRLHGLPAEIISDRDKLFTSKFWTAFTEMLGMKPKMSTAFHPQTDGQTERTNAIIEQYLRMNVGYLQEDWEEYLGLAEVAYNNATQTSTGFSPWFATKAFHPRTPTTVEISPTTSLPIGAQNFVDKMTKIQKEMTENMEEAKRRQKKYADQERRETEEYREGQKVWLKAVNIKTQRPSKKLDDKYLGPYQIERVLGKNVVKLALPETMKIHPVFHVSLIKPEKESKISGRQQEPSKPVIVEGEEEWEVEKILDAKKVRGQLRYLVSWKGFGKQDRTWEPIENLENAKETVEEFYKKYLKKPRN